LNEIFNSMLRDHRHLPTPDSNADSPPPLQRIRRFTNQRYRMSVTHASGNDTVGGDTGNEAEADVHGSPAPRQHHDEQDASSVDDNDSPPPPPPPRRRESRRSRRQWNRFQYSYFSTGDLSASNVTEEHNTTTLSTIPCEICSRNIPITHYIQHVERCSMRSPFEERAPPHTRRRTFLPFGLGDVNTEFSYLEQILGGRGNPNNIFQSLHDASTSGNDYEFNLLLQELIGHVSKGVKNKDAVTDVVSHSALPREENCSICIEPLHQEADGKVVRKIKKCGHMFCQTCLYLWFDNSNKCPNCVAEVDAMQ
jgi:hypothetical protein